MATDINSMSQDELICYLKDIKARGASFKEISDISTKYEIDPDTRRLAMAQLNKIDRAQKLILREYEKRQKRKKGLMTFLIGVAAMFFGFFLFEYSAAAGVVFIFNLVVWAFGGLLMLRGALHLIAGLIH